MFRASEQRNWQKRKRTRNLKFRSRPYKGTFKFKNQCILYAFRGTNIYIYVYNVSIICLVGILACRCVVSREQSRSAAVTRLANSLAWRGVAWRGPVWRDPFVPQIHSMYSAYIVQFHIYNSTVRIIQYVIEMASFRGKGYDTWNVEGYGASQASLTKGLVSCDTTQWRHVASWKVSSNCITPRADKTGYFHVRIESK